MFETQGLDAGLRSIEACAQHIRVTCEPSADPYDMECDDTDDTDPFAPYTADLVAEDDDVVKAAFRPTLAGAIGEVVMPVGSAVLQLCLERDMDIGQFAGIYDSDAEELSDKMSVAAEPYGPSRSNTLDCGTLEGELVGTAPSGHLGNQLDAMLATLTDRVPTPTPGSMNQPLSTIPALRHRSFEVDGITSECPRLWRVRLSPLREAHEA